MKKLVICIGMLAAAGCAQTQSEPQAETSAAQQVALPVSLTPVMIPKPEVKTELVSQLSTIEAVPEPAAFARHGAEGYDALRAIVADGSELPSVRSRAVTALGWADANRARTDLQVIAYDRSALPTCRRSAVLMLSKLGGAPMVQPLAGLLSDEDRDLRETTVRALARLKDPAAQELLRQRAGTETDPTIRDLLKSFTAK